MPLPPRPHRSRSLPPARGDEGVQGRGASSRCGPTRALGKEASGGGRNVGQAVGSSSRFGTYIELNIVDEPRGEEGLQGPLAIIPPPTVPQDAARPGRPFLGANGFVSSWPEAVWSQ
eukprot:6903699-Pyramimonas_sp.AAC.1